MDFHELYSSAFWDHRLSPYSSPLFFAKYLCQTAVRHNHLRYMGLFDMCHRSMPAAASHNIITAVKGRPPKPLKTPFMINITPQRAITPPIFLQRGTIFIFSFSSRVIFFQTVRYICPLPQANTMPKAVKTIPKNILIKSITSLLSLCCFLMLFPSSEKQYKKSAGKIPWPKPCDFLAAGQEKTAQNFRRSSIIFIFCH